MCRIRHGRLFVSDDLLHGWSRHETLVPCEVRWIILLEVELTNTVSKHKWDHHIPSDEGEIGDCAKGAILVSSFQHCLNFVHTIYRQLGIAFPAALCPTLQRHA